MILILVDAVRWDNAAHAGGRINVRAAADDRAGIEDAVAADLDVIAEHRAELLASGLDRRAGNLDGDKGLVALDVAGYRACAHVRLVAEDGVADVVIVRGLDVVEQDDVLELNGVADDCVLADDGAAADERAVADLRAVVDDAGRAEVSRGEHLCVLRHPYALAGVIELVRIERGAELEDEVLYPVKHLPGVGLAVKQFLCDGLIQIEKLFYFNHFPYLT